MSTASIVLDLVRAREGDRIRRRIEITIVVSLLLHAIAVYEWFPRKPLLTPGEDANATERTLTARLKPTPQQQPAQPPQATLREAPPPPRVEPRPTPRPQPRRTPPPPVITSPVPAPPITPPDPIRPPTPAPSLVVPPSPAPPPTAPDLSAYVQQQRAARGQVGDAPTEAESDTARRDRIVAQNLASLNPQTFGNAPQNGGGTFQIRRMDYQDAQFTFYGWNRDINRRTFQVIDVQRGNSPTINLAIVRKIIAIIRDFEQADFRWHSKRLGRDMTLSARREDTAQLEAFMMQEFFTDAMQAR